MAHKTWYVLQFAINDKFSSHMESVLMYCIYQNQSQKPISLGISSLDRFYNLP